ncbi:platelet endothelial cell adhesion molecule isoform X1 [Platichthys flesus]|uniref:platelet endothelial cell adhesion molecule isoform X1 n=1 Tax=Platichthys flesus TaxID=8260 RepID=UPI002DB5AD78|nr:platelet endothelial cell adhesion molecule isoform X1 [Platichthys flesus]
MDSRPPNLLLLLTGLLHLSPLARGQGSYIIDAVGLTVLPSSTVESGTPVTIHCRVTVSSENLPNLTHTFQLRQDDVPILSTITTEDTVVYKLNPARAADSGSYECQVTVKDKSKKSFNEKLDVRGLQTPVLNLSKRTLYKGDDFMATCSAPDEKGSLLFRFFQRFGNEQPERMKQVAATGNTSETTLVLRNVGDYFLYCAYEINLASGTRHSNHSNEIQVIVTELQISPIMNVLPSDTVYEGDIIEVVCKVVNSLQDVNVFLTRDRRILKEARVSLSHRFIAQEGDSGELVCKAEWGNVQKETYQKITVKELFSKPHLTVEPLFMFEGDRLKLTCSVTVYVPERINNKAMVFSIYRDKVEVARSHTYTAVANASTNGNYTCRALSSSLAHSFVKESPKLVVKAKVLVSKPVLSVVGGTLVLGTRFQLLCHSDIGTLPIKYTLHGLGKVIGDQLVSRPGQQALFNPPAIFKRMDLNNFICHASNSNTHPPEVGSVQQLFDSTNVIEPVSKPMFRIDPGMGDVSEGQDLTLTCSVQKGTPPITFTWYHAETAGVLASEISNKLEESFFIHNVMREHKGEYYCESNNPANETKRSYPVSVKVKLAHWKKGLIAGLCIVLVLALVLIVALKTRLLVCGRKRTGDLSVKSAGTKLERLSLTQAEVNQAANESDDQISEPAPSPQYTEVSIGEADPNRAPVKKGTDTVYSEVRNSMQGVPDPTDGQGSVEYADLNHDTDRHVNHDVQRDHVDGPVRHGPVDGPVQHGPVDGPVQDDQVDGPVHHHQMDRPVSVVASTADQGE